ncbi:MAG: GNAT family N-acetyltransferase [Tannerellaceae bacterium]|nr:GNAT family N-acetyltransferase [Tannerellaceae bacterium]MCD8263641.1 GNAT family N-acetyltransferase [Tannerellaceae bacterium]
MYKPQWAIGPKEPEKKHTENFPACTGDKSRLPVVLLKNNKEAYLAICEEENDIPLFSRPWWLDIVCGPDNWQVYIQLENNRILSCLPIYSPGNRIACMPEFIQTLGPWFAPEAADTKYRRKLSDRQRICKNYLPYLKQFRYFYQHFNYQVTDWLPFYWDGYKQSTRYTYVLENIADRQMLWNNMASNIRRNITKAKEKYGITVKTGIPVEEFLQVWQQTFRRQNLPLPASRHTLRQLIETSRQRGEGDIWGGYDSVGKLHAAVFVVWQKSAAYYIAGGGDPQWRQSGAHSLILWESIQYTSRFTNTFDFEGSMIQGIERFFREFGAKQIPYFTIFKGNFSLLDKIRLKIKRCL